MAIQAAGGAAIFFAGGVFAGMACRVSLMDASVFLIPDLTVTASVAYGLGASLNLALAPNLFLVNLAKLVASKVIGFFATVVLQKFILANAHSKTWDDIQRPTWEMAAITQYGAAVLLGIFAWHITE